MRARILVASVLVLAVAAAGEALVGFGAPAERAAAPEDVSAGGAGPAFTAGGADRYEADGRLLRTRVLRSGFEYLTAEAVAEAFPGSDRGLLDILRLATAPDGTLVLGVIRFPPGKSAESGVELWRGRELAGAFLVEPGSFGGGFAFGRAGDLIALFSHDGGLRGVYDFDGRRLEDFPDRFLLGR